MCALGLCVCCVCVLAHMNGSRMYQQREITGWRGLWFVVYIFVILVSMVLTFVSGIFMMSD